MAENSLELDKNPTPEEESEEFSTPDEKADLRAKNHELGLLKAKMGPIGCLIGSSNTSKTIAFSAIIICLVLVVIVFLWASNNETGEIADGPQNLLSLLISVVTGCIGFIFGSKGE